MFVSHIYDQGFVSRIYKEFLQLCKINNQTKKKKWTMELNTHFSHEDIQTANKHMKKIFNILSRQKNVNLNHNEIPLQIH